MAQKNVIPFSGEGTREVDMPDGSRRLVHMDSPFWDEVHFLRVVEGITTAEIASFALEEVSLQNITFNEAFQCIVAHFGNRWT